MADAPPEDDPSISPDDFVLRRVTELQVKWRDDGTVNRVGSNAFEDSSDCSPCSVVILSKLLAAGRRERDVLSGHEHRAGLVKVRVADLRDLGFGIVHTPTPMEPAHGSLTGNKSNRRTKKELAKRAVLVVTPPRGSRS